MMYRRNFCGLYRFICAIFLSFISTSLLASDNEMLTAQKLRQYCRACHGSGTQRFIFNDNNVDLWTYIYQNRAPVSGLLWADAIIDVLNWPAETPPPFERLKNPPNEDWMPRGIKRLDLHADQIDGRPVREIMLETLRGAGLK